MASINHKTVWITGASSGIGEATAYELSKKGCSLLLSARSHEALEKVKSKCQNPETVKVLPLDLMQYEQMHSKVKEAFDAFASIDILINNAGISQRSLIIDTDFEVYKKLMEVNYLGTVALTKAVLPYFIKQGQGHFVTVTSLMGKFGSPVRSGYCGSKHALHGFFDVLRMEHEKDHIKVSLIAPGFVRTNIAKNALIGDGKLRGREDSDNANGMRATDFAKKMVKAIEKGKFEVYMGGREVLGIYLKRFFPKLLHRVVVKRSAKNQNASKN
ncbi:Short-chain dehydrogenase [Zobellia uliginosa]|uniref:Short-chain dehydrogenase n=1 Tax=Zobellia uliginosa TaxID=143224 RepID=A0ABY1KPD9_9FLAO|nr:SDR family oxidoreductase [Zobellia uliginosa]SIS56011.1 Short-chain dehydrogenase [Zobellia uliginosa]